MSLLDNDRLFWIEFEPGSLDDDNAGRTVTGPYTNSQEDLQLLHKKLHERCGDDETAKEAVDELMEDQRYDFLHNKGIHTAASKLLFTIYVEMERDNDHIADQIRANTGPTINKIYTVRIRERTRRERSQEDILGHLDRYVLSGAKGFHVGAGRNIKTFSTKQDAVAYVKEFLARPGPDFYQGPQAMFGILSAMVIGGDYAFKLLLTVTKVHVSEDIREDVYDIDSVE
ncbi:Nn.00g074530.m01.CDS01 [Neocucurbitaria sp. VM-36]